MKTSTKLLIVLLLSVPLSMFAYGYLLKQQFNEGNFYTKVNADHPKYVFKSLASFKNVVVDGNLYLVYESSLTRKPNVKIEHFIGTRTTAIGNGQLIEFTNTQKEIGYSVLAGYEDIVKTKIKNDTLFISLFKFNGKGINIDQNLTFLSINNGNLKTLELTNGNYKIDQISGDDLSIEVKKADLVLENVKFDSLKLFATHAKSLSVDSSTISSLQYALLENSKLNLGANKIKAIENMGSDSLSVISVSGYAPWMEKFLPALTKTAATR